MQIAQLAGRLLARAAPTSCAAPWARRTPRRWPKERDKFVDGAVKNGLRREEGARRSSTRWRSSPSTASTSRTPPPTRSSPTRPPT